MSARARAGKPVHPRNGAVLGDAGAAVGNSAADADLYLHPALRRLAPRPARRKRDHVRTRAPDASAR